MKTYLAAVLLGAAALSAVAIAQPGQTPPGAGSGSAQPAPAPAPVPAGQPPAGQQPPGQQPPGQQPSGQNPTGTMPGTGPGLGTPMPPSPTQAKPVNVAPVNLSPKELEALKDIEAEYERFLIAANQHDTRMRQIAKREFDSRTSDLTNRYADRIARTEADKLKRHGDTIALLEKFLKDHPKHEQFTPDKMFQLADLYLDEADEDVERRLVEQEKAGPPDPNKPPPPPIVADYSKATGL